MAADWAPVQHGFEAVPSRSGASRLIPTVLFVYDIYADGPSIRTTPVSVTSAQFVADTGTEYVGFDGSSRMSVGS